MLQRLQNELRSLELDPPPGIAAWPKDEASITELEATIRGTADTPYAGGVFRLRVSVPQRYPLEPPSVRFVTPIYHPNIDSGGRICLDTLHMPPKGVWTPALNIAALLKTIQLLMNAPNPDDGLVVDITEQFKRDYASFEATAKAWTKKHAVADAVPSMPTGVGSSVNDVRGAATVAAAAAAAAVAVTALPLKAAPTRNAFDDDDSGEGGGQQDEDEDDDAEKHADKKPRV